MPVIDAEARSGSLVNGAELDAAWEVFSKRMAKVPEGASRDFKAKVIAIEGPITKPDKFAMPTEENPNPTKDVLEVTIELVDPKVAGPRWRKDVGKTFHEKSGLTALYLAVMNQPPPKGEAAKRFDTDTLLERELLVAITRGPTRADGKRGGIYSNVGAFKSIIIDDDDETI